MTTITVEVNPADVVHGSFTLQHQTGHLVMGETANRVAAALANPSASQFALYAMAAKRVFEFPLENPPLFRDGVLGEPHEMEELVTAERCRQLVAKITALEAENERIRANHGCARNQNTTQFCAEAVDAHKRIAALEADKARLLSVLVPVTDELYEMSKDECDEPEIGIRGWTEVHEKVANAKAVIAAMRAEQEASK